MKGAKKDQPWVSNYPPLKSWLEKIEARCLQQTPVGVSSDDDDDASPMAYLETWLANGHVFLVEVRANRLGWNIYTCADTNATDATLFDASQRLGIKS